MRACENAPTVSLSDYRLSPSTTRLHGKGARRFCRREAARRGSRRLPVTFLRRRNCQNIAVSVANFRQTIAEKGALRHELAAALPTRQCKKNGVIVSHKLVSAILIACSLIAFPALAQD